MDTFDETFIKFYSYMEKLVKIAVVSTVLILLFIWAEVISDAFKKESDYRSQTIAIQRERDSLQSEIIKLELRTHAFIDSVKI